MNTRRGSLKTVCSPPGHALRTQISAHPARKARFPESKDEQKPLLHKSPQLYVPDVDREQQGVDTPSNDANATVRQHTFIE